MSEKPLLIQTVPGPSATLANQLEIAWPGIGPAIALAGAAYPALLALGLSFVIIAASFNLPFTNELGTRGLGEGIVMVLVGGTVGAGIGLVWASIVCVAILPLVYLFVLSLQLRGSIVRLGAFAGGLVGCVAVMPFTVGDFSPNRATQAELVFMLLIG